MSNVASRQRPGGSEYQFAALPTIISNRANSCPDRIAVTDTVRGLTYKDLDDHTTRLAWHLTQSGVERGDIVGVMVDRSVDSVIEMLGVWKAGAAYVPIDPSYPRERIDYIITDSGMKTLIARQPLTDLIESDYPLATIDPSAVTDEGGWAFNSPTPAAPSDTAYIIYTSGSTGKPKGCEVSHENITHMLNYTTSLFDVAEDDRWLVFHSFSFDFSVWELWGAIWTGGKAVIAPEQATRSPKALGQVLVSEKITVLSQVPSTFRYFFGMHGNHDEFNLRYVVLGGESLDLKVVANFLKTYHKEAPRIINMYGITEITVHATFREITELDLEDSRKYSPIGKSLPHLSIEVRGADGLPLAAGEIGEIWISGSSVAKGYLNNPKLTEQRFVEEQSNEGVKRYYKSGDLARFSAGGELEYVGRNDSQVKLRGFRIELGEIEYSLRSHDAIVDAAVVVGTGPTGASILIAFLVVDEEQKCSDELLASLRQHVSASLPRYMVPNRYRYEKALPLTSSGKLDRNELLIRASQDTSA
ncbi:amino acid adenylation domain-containing protein [Streptomyces sp. DSM 41987]|uniref:amino acid adenylation domain-containing protein n=1 Tax=Streptomyces TaxID=1883 RepID=UPI003622B5B9